MELFKTSLLAALIVAVPAARAAENSLIYPQMQNCFNTLNNTCSLNIAKIVLATSAGALGGLLTYDAFLEKLKQENETVDVVTLSPKERSFWWTIAALLCTSGAVDESSNETLRWITRFSGICIATFGLLFCAKTINKKISAYLDHWIYGEPQQSGTTV